MVSNLDPELTRSLEHFAKCLCDLATPEDRMRLLAATLSRKELATLGKRWEILLLLKQGKNQREAREETGAARLTVSRASKTLKDHEDILGQL